MRAGLESASLNDLNAQNPAKDGPERPALSGPVFERVLNIYSDFTLNKPKRKDHISSKLENIFF